MKAYKDASKKTPFNIAKEWWKKQGVSINNFKAIYNNIKDANMFQTPESFREGFNQVLKAGAQEMVGGWIMSVPGAMSNAAAFAPVVAPTSCTLSLIPSSPSPMRNPIGIPSGSP